MNVVPSSETPASSAVRAIRAALLATVLTHACRPERATARAQSTIVLGSVGSTRRGRPKPGPNSRTRVTSSHADSR
jgi:hypothetical protein